MEVGRSSDVGKAQSLLVLMFRLNIPKADRFIHAGAGQVTQTSGDRRRARSDALYSPQVHGFNARTVVSEKCGRKSGDFVSLHCVTALQDAVAGTVDSWQHHSSACFSSRERKVRPPPVFSADSCFEFARQNRASRLTSDPNHNKHMHHLKPILICLAALMCTSVKAAQLKYSIDPKFFDEMPGGEQLGPCHGGAVIDRAGNIYITTDTPRGIAVFSPKGKFLRAVGPTGIHALEIRKEKGVEHIYAARPNHNEVVKLKLTGETEWTLRYPPEAGIYKDEKGFRPCAVTVAPDGSIFVADGYGSNYVLKFDKNRKFVKAFGGPGEADGKFKTCHGIGLDTRRRKPLLIVCNRNNNRVEHWDLDGNFVKVIQRNLRMPAAVHVRGNYAVFPELQGRVTVLDQKGNIAAQLGDNPDEKQRANFGLPPDQWKAGICNSPHGASLDKNGNIIVSEWSKFGHLHRFVRVKQ